MLAIRRLGVRNRATGTSRNRFKYLRCMFTLVPLALLGASQEFDGLPGGPLTLRLDVTNVFDKKYAIRDGSGIGVGAPQFGPRRGVFVGVTKAF